MSAPTAQEFIDLVHQGYRASRMSGRVYHIISDRCGGYRIADALAHDDVVFVRDIIAPKPSADKIHTETKATMELQMIMPALTRAADAIIFRETGKPREATDIDDILDDVLRSMVVGRAYRPHHEKKPSIFTRLFGSVS
jgi:hypothetical protein